MAEKTDKGTALLHAQAILKFKRDGNRFVRVELLTELMKEHGFKPEDLGTTVKELRLLEIEDCRNQVESDLINWRITYDIQTPGEKCFAEGIVEALRDGGLKYEDFGISDIELRYIRQAAGLK